MAGTTMNSLVTVSILMLLVIVSSTEAKPFNTNVNTNYNNNYNANLNANYLISSLLNYILNLLQIIHKNGKQSDEAVDIPPFPQLHDIPQLLRLHPPADALQLPSSNSMDVNKEPTPIIKGDFNILDDYVFDHIIKNRESVVIDDDGSVADEGRKAIQAAVDAFRGPEVPPLVQPVPLDSWGLPLVVQEPPELQATKMELLKSFSEAQTRTG